MCLTRFLSSKLFPQYFCLSHTDHLQWFFITLSECGRKPQFRNVVGFVDFKFTLQIPDEEISITRKKIYPLFVYSPFMNLVLMTEQICSCSGGSFFLSFVACCFSHSHRNVSPLWTENSTKPTSPTLRIMTVITTIVQKLKLFFPQYLWAEVAQI